MQQPSPLSGNTLRTAATLCGSAALLMAVAVFVSGVSGNSNILQLGLDSQSAATALAIQQGVTSYSAAFNFNPTSQPGYPMPLRCWSGGNEQANPGYPNCNTGNYLAPGVVTGYHVNMAVFSAHISGSQGESKVLTATTVEGTPEPAGFNRVCERDFGEDTQTCYSECSGDYMNGPQGYGCYSIPTHLEYSTVSYGSPVSIPPNTPVTLEWSCQPSQAISYATCDGWEGCFFDHPTLHDAFATPYFQNIPTLNFGVANDTRGSITVTLPVGVTNYQLTCNGSAGSQTLTIPVTGLAPSATISANPPTLGYNQRTTATWSSANVQPNSCAEYVVAPSAVNFATSNSGSAQSPPLTQSGTLEIDCRDYAGNWVISTTPITVGSALSVSISAAPGAVAYGDHADVTWSAANADACTVSGPGISSTATNGTQSTGTLTASATYTLSCSGSGGQQASVSTTVVVGNSPALSITPYPGSVPYGGSSTITWSADNVTSCAVAGPGISSTALSGSQSTGALTSEATYTLTCQSTSGEQSASAVVSVAGAPGLSITATPQSIPYNGYSDVAWSATNVDSCVVNNDFGQVGSGLTGSQHRGPFQDAQETFTLVCQSASGQKTKSVTVTVGGAPHQTISLSASPASVYQGQSSALTWTTANVSTCSLSGGSWGGGTGVANAGSNVSTGAIVQDTTYTLTCQSPYGYAAAASSTTVTTQALPPVSFSANPTSVLPQGASTLTWNCSNPPYTSSQGDANYSTGGAVSGSAQVTPADTTTYSVRCIVSGNTGTTKEATVTVLQPDLTITATPARVQKGKTSTIAWSATNITAGSCSVISSPAGFNYSGASGSQMPIINVATTFTLQCSVPSGTVSQSVTVNLIPKFQEI